MTMRGLWFEEFEPDVIYQHAPGRTFGEAYAKAQAASGVTLPRSGAALISVRERDKPGAVGD